MAAVISCRLFLSPVRKPQTGPNRVVPVDPKGFGKRAIPTGEQISIVPVHPLDGLYCYSDPKNLEPQKVRRLEIGKWVDRHLNPVITPAEWGLLFFRASHHASSCSSTRLTLMFDIQSKVPPPGPITSQEDAFAHQCSNTIEQDGSPEACFSTPCLSSRLSKQ